MTDRLTIEDEKEEEVKAELKKIDFHIQHGSVKITIRHGKPTFIATTKTDKLD